MGQDFEARVHYERSVNSHPLPHVIYLLCQMDILHDKSTVAINRLSNSLLQSREFSILKQMLELSAGTKVRTIYPNHQKEAAITLLNASVHNCVDLTRKNAQFVHEALVSILDGSFHSTIRFSPFVHLQLFNNLQLVCKLFHFEDTEPHKNIPLPSLSNFTHLKNWFDLNGFLLSQNSAEKDTDFDTKLNDVSSDDVFKREGNSVFDLL